MPGARTDAYWAWSLTLSYATTVPMNGGVDFFVFFNVFAGRRPSHSSRWFV